MPPKELAGGFWFIPEGEYIEDPKDPKNTINGPAPVRVHEFPDINKLSIQGPKPGIQIEIEGMDFLSAVKQR